MKKKFHIRPRFIYVPASSTACVLYDSAMKFITNDFTIDLITVQRNNVITHNDGKTRKYGRPNVSFLR